jgi:hypothetical protein
MWLAAALMAAALTVWGCAPADVVGESTAAIEATSNQVEVMPAATADPEPSAAQPTADPVPDPEAAGTTAPGEHLDAVGTITALDEASITVDGVVYGMTASTEVKGTPAIGGRVKLEYVVNADGSRTVIEAKTSEFFDE